MPDLPLVGEEFAGFRLTAILGRGGMSVVYRAENPRLGNVIALKVLDPSLASDDIFRTRFLEESRIAASMNHPNVIPIHDMGSDGGLLYIAMRCVMGTDLRQMLKKRGRLQPDTAVFLLEQAGRALDAAHRHGLVHRDVKPGNLLVERGNDGTDPDHLYLADFGITKHLGGRTGLTSTGQFLGTIDYVAPEQIRGTSVLGYADQYSLGCVLYECLTGRVPFEKDLDAAIIWAHVEEAPTRPTLIRPDLPPAIDEVFDRVLAKDPEARFDSCRDFVAAAREALGHLADPPGTGVSGPGGPSMGGPAQRFTPPSGAGARLAGARLAGAQLPGAGGTDPAAAAHLPTELTHETMDASSAKTTNWAALDSEWNTPEPGSLEQHLDYGVPPVPQPGWPGGSGTNTDAGQDSPGRRRGLSLALLAGIAAMIVVAGGAAAVTMTLMHGHGSTAGAATVPTVSGAPTSVPMSMPPTVAASSSGPGAATPAASPTMPPTAMTAAARTAYCSPDGGEATDAQDKGLSGPTSLKQVLQLADLCSTPENAIPLRTCSWSGTTTATCTAPSAGVASVTFETYPSVAALYSAYQTQITQLARSYSQNTKSACKNSIPGYSETGWNHEDGHPANFTVAQMESPSFNPVAAMGRQACFTAGGSPYLIWTTDDGDMLAVARGTASMSPLYNWWGNVHHVILFPQTEMCGPNMERMTDAPQGNLITAPVCPAGVSGSMAGM